MSAEASTYSVRFQTPPGATAPTTGWSFLPTSWCWQMLLLLSRWEFRLLRSNPRWRRKLWLEPWLRRRQSTAPNDDGAAIQNKYLLSTAVYIDRTLTLHVAANHTYSGPTWHMALRYFLHSGAHQEGKDHSSLRFDGEPDIWCRDETSLYATIPSHGWFDYKFQSWS